MMGRLGRGGEGVAIHQRALLQRAYGAATRTAQRDCVSSQSLHLVSLLRLAVYAVVQRLSRPPVTAPNRLQVGVEDLIGVGFELLGKTV